MSVIVPIYNVEKYIERCTTSLMEQSYDNIEYIFVDDCTADNSINLLESLLKSYPTRLDQVRVIRHDVNKGLPTARNTGLKQAEGVYVFHCDSDDWLDVNMITDMVEAALCTGADIVYSDFYLSFHKNERYMKQPQYTSPEACIRGMLSGKMKFNVWNKLVRRKLYVDNNVWFPDGRSMGEDMTMFRLFCHARGVAYLNSAYYHYIQTNPNAFTKRMSEAQLADILYNVRGLESYLRSNAEACTFNHEINFFKLNTKLPFLISLDKKLYSLWRDWFPEANDAIGLNPDFSLRAKLLQYAALYRQDWYIKVYNLVVVKFVYGIIYK